MDIKKKKITSSKVNSVGAPLSPEEEIAWLVSFSKGRGSGSEREKEDTTKQIIKYKAVRNERARAYTHNIHTHAWYRRAVELQKRFDNFERERHFTATRSVCPCFYKPTSRKVNALRAIRKPSSKITLQTDIDRECNFLPRCISSSCYLVLIAIDSLSSVNCLWAVISEFARDHR